MADVLEISHYNYYVFSSRDGDAKAVMLLYGSTGGQIGYVYFRDDAQTMADAEKLSDGKITLSYRYRDLPVLIDMLRNEKPVYLIYVDGINSRISSAAEPVGEGEM